MRNARIGTLALLLMVLSAGWPTRASGAPFVYVANESEPGTISVVDTATNTATATIAVENFPRSIAVHPAGTHVYVCGLNKVSVIDTASKTVTAAIPVSGAGFCNSVAVHPAGTRLYVAASNFPSSFVSVVDTATNSVVATVSVVGASDIAVHPTGTRVYVAGGNTLSVIDAATNTVATTVAVSSINSVAVHPAGVRVYVTGLFKGSVAVIDTATNTVRATVPVGLYPDSMTVHPAGTHLYVADAAGDTVRVIDTATDAVVATITIRVRTSAGTITFNSDAGVAVHPAGTHLYVINSTPGIRSLSVIDTASNTVAATALLNLIAAKITCRPPGGPGGFPLLEPNIECPLRGLQLGRCLDAL